jgi:hypothetical protein
MARKKKNKHSQTFDVYPYLDEYQYLMKTGGALPWYQTKGPVETKRKYTVEGVEYDTYEEFVEAWNKKMPNANPPPKEYLDKQYDNNTGTHNSTDQPVDNECECPEGSENAGTTYFSSGGCGYNKSMCGEMIDGTSQYIASRTGMPKPSNFDASINALADPNIFFIVSGD